MSACEASTAKLPIDQLIDQIKEEFSKKEKPSPDVIKGLLAAYIAAGHQDWREFALFNTIKYSRNLLEFNENFELIVLCWLPGQESPIHNHSGQNCWMAVLEGEMEEVYYNFDENTGLTEGTSQVHRPGEVGFIADDIALHKVRPVTGGGCTMHLYSKPIPLCLLYCPETGKVTKRQLGFFSRRGKKLCEGDPASACYVELKKQLCQGNSSCPAAYKQLLQQIDSN